MQIPKTFYRCDLRAERPRLLESVDASALGTSLAGQKMIGTPSCERQESRRPAKGRPESQQAGQVRAKRQRILIFEPAMPAGTKTVPDNPLPNSLVNRIDYG